MSNIVGVRYIGSKQRKEDNVLNTGVVWSPNQVINFDAASAATLAQHAGVWEITDVDHDAETKIAGTVKKAAGDPRKHEPQTFANVNAMDKDQLHAFARTSLLRQLPDLETDKLREEVKSLLTLNFLDDQQGLANAKKPEEKLIISLHVSQEEFTAFESGALVLKLVPKAAESEQTGSNEFSGSLTQTGSPLGSFSSGSLDFLDKIGGDPTPADLDDALEQLPGEYAAEDVGTVVAQMQRYFGTLFTPEVEATVRGLFKPAEQAPESTSTANTAGDQTGNTDQTNADPHAQLKADLAQLDAKQLREMCKKLNLAYANTMSADVLRKKIIDAAAEGK